MAHLDSSLAIGLPAHFRAQVVLGHLLLKKEVPWPSLGGYYFNLIWYHNASWASPKNMIGLLRGQSAQVPPTYSFFPLCSSCYCLSAAKHYSHGESPCSFECVGDNFECLATCYFSDFWFSLLATFELIHLALRTHCYLTVWTSKSSPFYYLGRSGAQTIG